MSENKEQLPFLQYLKHNHPHPHLQCPIRLSEYWKNLEDPIGYIQSNKILEYKKQEDNIIDEIKNIKDNSQRFSKNINKKVINRENIEYKFDINFNDIDRNIFENFEFKQRISKDKKQNDAKFNLRMAEFERSYRHGQSSQKEKIKIEQQAITMKIIKTIDTPEFQKYKNNQIYNLFMVEQKAKQKFTGSVHNLSENDDLKQLCKQVRFQMRDDEEYFSQKSQEIFLNTKQLKFWKKQAKIRKPNETDILARCRKLKLSKGPSYNELLDFSTEKLTGQVLQQIIRLKKIHDKEIQLDKNNQNLQQQYNKAKSQLQFLRQFRKNNKTHRVNYKNDDKIAQTLQNLDDKSFDSYFQQDTKQILIKLDQLIQMRQLLIQQKNPQKKKISLVNMYHQIRKQCFKLLAMIFKNQDFPQYFQFIQIQDKKLAQRMMLQTIYKQFNKIKTPQVDGIKKSQILKRYLKQRQMNQKVFQLLQLQI